MSLCDTCSKPGACCHDFWLNLPTVWENGWYDQAMYNLARKDPSLPFVAHRFIPADVPEPGYEVYGHVRWTCPKLSADGRCTIYETRPDVCRNYKPASDALCVEYVKPTADVIYLKEL